MLRENNPAGGILANFGIMKIQKFMTVSSL